MPSLEIISSSEARTEEIASQLARRLRGGEVIALTGELGAGKTCFVRGLAAGLGIDRHAVSSPTFIIRQEYGAARPGSPSLAHLDGYRLGGLDEVEMIGWDELLDRRDCVIAVEWAERFAPLLPEERIDIELTHLDVGARRMLIASTAGLDDRLAAVRAYGQGGSSCPVCSRPVAEDAATFPFCSPRCRMADLGNWMGGRYRLSRAASEEDWFEVEEVDEG